MKKSAEGGGKRGSMRAQKSGHPISGVYGFACGDIQRVKRKKGGIEMGNSWPRAASRAQRLKAKPRGKTLEVSRGNQFLQGSFSGKERGEKARGGKGRYGGTRPHSMSRRDW